MRDLPHELLEGHTCKREGGFGEKKGQIAKCSLATLRHRGRALYRVFFFNALLTCFPGDCPARREISFFDEMVASCRGLFTGGFRMVGP